ncbi:MAG: glycosyltransferase family 2 protein [Paracoccus sp. (in: a-proteobacteria)]
MTSQPTHQTLAVVIPVWNLPEDLATLLDQIRTLAVFDEVIVVDDASDPACDPRGVDWPGTGRGRLVYLRSDQQRGAGHARNLGLTRVTATNVIFFDADDHLTPEFADIWRRHAEGIPDDSGATVPPDFTIFRHADSRVASGEASFPAEEAIWSRILDDHPEAILTARQRATMAGLSAYPWNKIYRTDFLRQTGIRCSETPVHNDLKLHWLSFAQAQRVMALPALGAVHIVGERDHHLTQRIGNERFCVFEVIADVRAQLRGPDASAGLMRQFLLFTDKLLRWNLERIDPALRPRFLAACRSSLLGFTSAEFTLFAQAYPDQARLIVELLIHEEA